MRLMSNIIRFRCKITGTNLNSINSAIDVFTSDAAVPVQVLVLPSRIKRFTVLRSPHIDKKARDQFELRIHSRLVSVPFSTKELAFSYAEAVQQRLPSGVSCRFSFCGV